MNSITIKIKRRVITLNMMKYGWSKWGGGNQGLVKEELDEWFCQSCAKPQRKGLPSYMVESAEREFMRVCSACKHKMVQNRLRDYWSLLGLIKRD